jgi:hypothetical protein
MFGGLVSFENSHMLVCDVCLVLVGSYGFLGHYIPTLVTKLLDNPVPGLSLSGFATGFF